MSSRSSKSFEDRPFKQLSSGMKSRLAFSIASLVQPDILILDEVLSVGDGAFRNQERGNKMREIHPRRRRHASWSPTPSSQVRDMCNKILWLDHGKQIAFTDQVNACCTMYDEALKTKKLPAQEQINSLLRKAE